MTIRPVRRALLLSTLLLLGGLAHAQQAARVKLATSAGDIVLELAPDKAPKTVASFVQYVRDGHYDGTIFHRVIDGFMIQGGGFTPDMRQKPAPRTVENEAGNGLKNQRGTIAMARTPDPHSASAQFFINVADNEFLNFKAPTPQGYGYAVFGRVVEGMEVIDKIRTVPTGNAGMHQNVPRTPILINSATLLK